MTWVLAYNSSSVSHQVDSTETRWVPPREFTFVDNTDPVVIELMSAEQLVEVPITFDTEDTSIDYEARQAAREVAIRNSPAWEPPQPALDLSEINELIQTGRLSPAQVRPIIVISKTAPVPPGTRPGTVIIRTN